jgi:hypothetical protein
MKQFEPDQLSAVQALINNALYNGNPATYNECIKAAISLLTDAARIGLLNDKSREDIARITL